MADERHSVGAREMVKEMAREGRQERAGEITRWWTR